MDNQKLNIKVNHHSSICIDDNLYFDPFKISEKINNAKVVFITHSHWDHLDLLAIKNISNAETFFVCTEDSAQKILQAGIYADKIKIVKPNEKFKVLGILCETFNSYNINKQFHPKANGWVGYTIGLNGVRYTICGDSDLTEVLKQIKTDVLFVPIGGTYTMTALEAAKLANIIKPELVIPVHYGEVVGSEEDERAFISNLDKEIKTKILLKI